MHGQMSPPAFNDVFPHSGIGNTHTARVSSRHPQLHPTLRQCLRTFTYHIDLHSLRGAVHPQLPLPLASPLAAANP